MRITKEGYPHIIIFGILMILSIFSHFKFLFYVFSVLCLFSLYFFRDPVRFSPKISNFFVSPADGKVLKIEEIYSDFTDDLCYKISIFMSIFDVHINRMPFKGKIEKKDYREGKFFNASFDKASEENERLEYIIDAGNFKYKVTQIAGVIARRIVSYVKEGDLIDTGKKLGMIKFGSRAEVVIPKNVIKLNVYEGQQVYAGESVIGIINLEGGVHDS